MRPEFVNSPTGDVPEVLDQHDDLPDTSSGSWQQASLQLGKVDLKWILVCFVQCNCHKMLEIYVNLSEYKANYNHFTSDSLIMFCSFAISVTLWCKSWQAIFSSVRSNLKAGTRSTVNLTSPGPSTLRMTGAPPVDLVTLQFIKMI